MSESIRPPVGGWLRSDGLVEVEGRLFLSVSDAAEAVFPALLALRDTVRGHLHSDPPACSCLYGHGAVKVADPGCAVHVSPVPAGTLEERLAELALRVGWVR